MILIMIHVTIWRSGLVNALVSINKVNLRRAQLVLGWMTMSGVQLPVQENLSLYNQSPRSTQSGHPSVGRRNEYQPTAVMPCSWGVNAGMVRE